MFRSFMIAFALPPSDVGLSLRIKLTGPNPALFRSEYTRRRKRSISIHTQGVADGGFANVAFSPHSEQTPERLPVRS